MMCNLRNFLICHSIVKMYLFEANESRFFHIYLKVSTYTDYCLTEHNNLWTKFQISVQ